MSYMICEPVLMKVLAECDQTSSAKLVAVREQADSTHTLLISREMLGSKGWICCQISILKKQHYLLIFPRKSIGQLS